MIPCFVCRCEDVVTREIDHAISCGMTSIEEIKRFTGLGTGPCQGKECLPALARLLVERGLCAPEDLAPFTPRPPTEPVSLAALAALDPEPAADPEPDPEGAPP